MGEKQNQPFQLSFNGSLKVDFQVSRVTSDGSLILIRELDERLLGFPYPEEAGLAPLWAAGLARGGKDEKTAPMEAVGCILAAGRADKMGILE